MNIIRVFHISTALMVLVVGGETAIAQDTTKKKTIDITSTFKPVLREAVKLNFSAALPAFDTIRPVMDYSIPQQNVKLPYQAKKNSGDRDIYRL